MLDQSPISNLYSRASYLILVPYERYEVLLSSELAQMKQNELAHLEQEFEAYGQKYPQE